MTRAPIVRSATAADAADVAEIWHRGWKDGHVGHVPADLVAVRTEESFRSRAGERVGDTVVAEVEDRVAGFFMLADDELEQLYVDCAYRGHGIAPLLIEAAAEAVAAAGHQRIWLAVAAGNQRARRFYAKVGWTDEGPFVYHAAGPTGPVPVPCHRFSRALT